MKVKKSALTALPVIFFSLYLSEVPAQQYPGKPVRVIVPFGAGGPADIYARYLAQRLQEPMGQSFVVDDRPGAGSIIGTDLVAKSPADGYTLLLMSNTHTVNESLVPKKPFALMKDFVPIAPINYSDLVLVVHPSVPARTLAQFVALAKVRPGQISVANTGAGTPTQLAAELFKSAAGINLLSVPYKGAAPANTDLLGGQVVAMFNNPINALPFARAGKLRALAVTGAQRLSIAPELPTIAESGYPNFEAGTWYGFFGPAQLPPDIVAKIHADVVAVLRLPDIQQKLVAQGWDSIGNNPAEFAAVLKADFDKWAKVVKAAGLRAD
jgi:tripartite-type tricarboxylate transporter receptor subunit TctC